MIEIIKHFTDMLDDFKPYNKGDKADFGKDRNDSLVNRGYAKHLPKPETKKKNTKKQ